VPTPVCRKQGRQCTCNVTLWRVRVTIVAMERQQYVDLHVAVNNLKVFSVVMKMQQWVSFALLSSYKIFRTAVNNINLLRSSCKVPDFLSDFNQI
jgi:hypothetical protein